jgi:hypothetical protein
MVRVGPLAKGRSRDGLQGTGLLFFFFFFCESGMGSGSGLEVKTKGVKTDKGILIFFDK